MTDNAASALVIRNIGMFEEASLLLAGEIQETIQKAICRLMENWSKEHSWSGAFEGLAEGDVWFAPDSWKKPDNESAPWVGRYWWGTDNNYDSDFWALSSYCGTGKGRVGITFQIDYGALPGLSRGKWKAYLKENLKDYPKISEAGFHFHDSYWILPWQLDPNKLADVYTDSIEEALEPVLQAMDKIKLAHPEFERLVQEISGKYGQD